LDARAFLVLCPRGLTDPAKHAPLNVSGRSFRLP